ncbi:YicC/YloC family endoribonuclease [Pontibacillus litoralis]|nr:YicC/YloC family endoribonuclease [Pontibacillus litoralis]
MTGYGRHTVTIEDTMITIEVKTVNHRFLDISTKIPRSLLYLEGEIHKRIKQYIQRGKVDVYVTFEGSGFLSKQIQMDWALLDQWMSQLEHAKKRYKLQGEVNIDALTTLPEVMTLQEKENYEPFEGELLQYLDIALQHVSDMRKKEGQALCNDLEQRLERIRSILYDMMSRRKIVIQMTRERILKRMEEYVDVNGLEEETRMYQEIALMAEKGDITEELTRLFSHLEQFCELLQVKEPIGRQLEFIVQEIQREMNTIGSKSNDTEISLWVVQLKSETEKIKEQIQNVE